ncbi:MAG: cation:proton antiporter [Planctomycetes bacterium]|nr:cation:proton antiporter [Planctomycetota bacterium]
MPEFPILKELLLVMSLSLVTVYAVRSLRVPNIVGFLIAGIAMGPGALGLVKDVHTIEVLAEIGIVLLLFTIGVKISLKDLARMGGVLIGAGGLQVLATTVLVAGIAWLAGIEPRRSLFLGFLVALSSTAVVLKLLEDRGESNAPHGRIALGILIFQDLAIVPMMLLLPLLAQHGDASWSDAFFALLRSVLLVALLVSAAVFLLPWVLERVVRTRSPEIFTLAVLVVVLGTALLTSEFGLSLALGAFLAGLVVSESRYASQVLADVTPFRDSLGGLFFVSVGMLVDPGLWLAAPLTTLGLALGLAVLKAAVVFAVALAFGFGTRVATLSALGLAQVGEFSFLLAEAGRRLELFRGDLFQMFLSVSVLSMAVTPLAMLVAPRLARVLQRLSIPGRRGRTPGADEAAAIRDPTRPLRDHVVIVGAGVAGQNVARVLRSLAVEHLFLELNPITVREMQKSGVRILYGDATKREVLSKARITRARVLVVTIPDPAAARQIVVLAHALNPELILIVRTRFVSEVDELTRLGANEVVPEEFVTAIELVGLVLATYGVPERRIAREKTLIRGGRYRLLRGAEAALGPHASLKALAASADFDEVVLAADSPAGGQDLRALALRNRAGVTVVGVEREGHVTGNPDPGMALAAGDILLLFGTAEQLDAARALLEPPPAAADAPPPPAGSPEDPDSR